MSWVAVSMAGIGMIQQGQKAKQENRNMRAQNQLSADQERTSWATGRAGGPTNFNYQNVGNAMLGGAAAGGMSGLSYNQQNAMGKPMASGSSPMAMNTNPTNQQSMYESLLNQRMRA